MGYKLNVGDRIPHFKTKDNEGYDLTDEDLIGSPTVVYFYPKDDTPGCTKEACSFRDNMTQMDSLDTLVIGISPDNSDSHQNFIEKHSLNFTLLPDEKKELCKKFDVLKDNNVERTTFVIDADGFIRWIERPVNLEGHIERVLKAIRALED